MKHFFNSPKEVEEKAERYFEECEEKSLLPTKGGFALYCNGYAQLLYSYEKKPKYKGILNIIYQRILQAWVQKLKSNQVAGIIFYLKNAFREEFDAPDNSRIGGNVTYSWKKSEIRGRKGNDTNATKQWQTKRKQTSPEKPLE